MKNLLYGFEKKAATVQRADGSMMQPKTPRNPSCRTVMIRAGSVGGHDKRANVAKMEGVIQDIAAQKNKRKGLNLGLAAASGAAHGALLGSIVGGDWASLRAGGAIGAVGTAVGKVMLAKRQMAQEKEIQQDAKNIMHLPAAARKKILAEKYERLKLFGDAQKRLDMGRSDGDDVDYDNAKSIVDNRIFLESPLERAIAKKMYNADL